MICPRCKNLAARRGEWDKVHTRDRDNGREFWVEEAVCCTDCGAFLLASPDDDIDPVKEDEPYDESVYHTFVRPDNWIRPTQKVFNRAPVPGEWVAVRPGTKVKIQDIERSLDKCEGRVVSIEGDAAEVEVNGFSGMMKSDLVTIDIHRIRPMVFDILEPGCNVILVSKKGDVAGVFRGSSKGTAEVETNNGDVERVPIERIKRTYHDEVVYNV